MLYEVITFPDADLERVIPGAARGAFFLQGQNCMAGTRIFIHDSIYAPLVEGLKAFADSMAIGHRITSYNVCYTKLLRTMSRRRAVTDSVFWALMVRSPAQELFE